MEFMIWFGKWCADVSDYVLAWLLALPHDIVVLFVACSTVVLLTIGRRLLTNQDLMRRCDHDTKRLNQLLKQAKRNKDKNTIKNIQLTMSGIQLKQLGAEFKGMALGIIPIIFLACWAFERLEFRPPAVGEEFRLRVTYPLEDRNKQTWVRLEPAGLFEVCPDQVSSVQDIITDDNIDPFTGNKIAEGEINGIAEWTFKAVKPGHAVVTVQRGEGKELQHNIRAGGFRYGDALNLPMPEQAPWVNCSSSLVMERALFLGWVPGMKTFWNWYRDVANWTGPPPATTFWGNVKAYGLMMPIYAVSRITWFPPWLIAYICLTIPLIPLTRKLMRVY